MNCRIRRRASSAQQILAIALTFIFVSVAAAQPPARKVDIKGSNYDQLRTGDTADGKIVGYAYASLYRTRSAYRHTLEDSVYVREGFAGRGIGLALLRELIERCSHGPGGRWSP